MATLIPYFPQSAANLSQVAIARRVRGVEFDALASRALQLTATRHLRCAVWLIASYERATDNTLDSSTFYLPFRSGIGGSLEIICGVADIDSASAITVTLREAPTPDVNGYSTPGAGALIDRGFKARAAPFRALQGAVARGRWRTGQTVAWIRPRLPVVSDPTSGAGQTIDGARLLDLPSDTDCELTVVLTSVALTTLVVREKWEASR